MTTPSRQSNNMSMNSLNTTSHNAERIAAIGEKLSQIQVKFLIINFFSLISKMINFQN